MEAGFQMVKENAHIMYVLLHCADRSCMATMFLLYYRLLQGASSEDITELNNNQINLE
jgi:hypothetical protein